MQCFFIQVLGKGPICIGNVDFLEEEGLEVIAEVCQMDSTQDSHHIVIVLPNGDGVGRC